MMEIQKQWMNVDGKWQHMEVSQAPLSARPALPSRLSQAPMLLARTSTPSAPALPSRPAAKSPALPPRRPSETPSSHHRRPSDMMLSRRDSNESVRSTATADTSFSAMSNGTSFTSSSERFTIRAPEYDPSVLPKLPPKRTQEEKDAAAYAARFPAKTRKSSSQRPRSEAPAVQPPERPQSIPPPARPAIGNLPEDIESETPAGPKAILPSNRGPAGGHRVLPFSKSDILRQQEQPEVPPLLPKRQSCSLQSTAAATPSLPKRPLAPPPPKRSALSMGFIEIQQKGDNTRPAAPRTLDATPPPVPLSSRPDLSTLQASKPKLNGAQTQGPVPSAGACLLCRDFSAPDAHAALFPRAQLPCFDAGWLAARLTEPFPSATDKARSIFAWLHHNVEYDVVGFFNNNIQRRTPQQTLECGLAVCEGYASLFVLLALKVGLEAVIVGGNGKGFGYTPLEPGAVIPPYKSGHAWNAVKIDGGAWKLVDPCWGAGSVGGKGQPYSKHFSPAHFTKSNDEFGLSHYPEDRARQYRNDGRVMSWEEYMTCNKNGTAATVWSGYTIEEGVSDISFEPVANPIVLAQQGPTVRFKFQKVCPHWDPARCGKGAYYLYVLHTQGLDGTERNHIPFKPGDGIWWCDVPIADLGRLGQQASIYTVTTYDGKDARGLTVDQYLSKKGRVGMSFGGVAQWTMA